MTAMSLIQGILLCLSDSHPALKYMLRDISNQRRHCCPVRSLIQPFRHPVDWLGGLRLCADTQLVYIVEFSLYPVDAYPVQVTFNVLRFGVEEFMPKIFGLIAQDSGLKIANLIDYNMQLFDVGCS